MLHRSILILAIVLGLGCRQAPAQTAGTAAPAKDAAVPAGAAAPAAPATKHVPADLPAVVARVNGEAIERAQLEKAVRQVSQRAGGAVPPEQRDAVYRGVLDQLVAYKLLSQESLGRKLSVADADVEGRIAEIRKRFPKEDAFQQALSSEGMTLEGLGRQIRSDLLVAKLIDAELASQVNVQPQEVESFYQKNPHYFQEPEKVRASHILIQVPQGADQAARDKARAEADALLAQIKGGADFAALAKAHSQDPGSAPSGGDLGFFGKGQMVPAFENAAFALKPGEVSGVVESPFGLHIIKLVERKPARTVPLDEVSAHIKEFLTQQAREQKTHAFVERLKTKGKVEILI